MGALLHDVGKPPTFRVAERIRFDGHVEEGVRLAEGILDRLRFSRHETEQVLALVANHMRFKDVRPHEGEHAQALPAAARVRASTWSCIAWTCWRATAAWKATISSRGKLAEYSAEHLKPPRLVTGADLIAAGYTPGPLFSEILALVEDAQLEGRVRSRDEALQLVESAYAALKK